MMFCVFWLKYIFFSKRNYTQLVVERAHELTLLLKESLDFHKEHYYTSKPSLMSTILPDISAISHKLEVLNCLASISGMSSSFVILFVISGIVYLTYGSVYIQSRVFPVCPRAPSNHVDLRAETFHFSLGLKNYSHPHIASYHQSICVLCMFLNTLSCH